MWLTDRTELALLTSSSPFPEAASPPHPPAASPCSHPALHFGPVGPTVAGARAESFYRIGGAQRGSVSAAVEISEAEIVEAFVAVSDTPF